MSRKDTKYGAYHIRLEEEIKRIGEGLTKAGISHPTKIEASALIAERSKLLTMTDEQAKVFIRKIRGVI